ncbi:unnamed protein product [Jaminaea pallidilutea]
MEPNRSSQGSKPGDRAKGTLEFSPRLPESVHGDRPAHGISQQILGSGPSRAVGPEPASPAPVAASGFTGPPVVANQFAHDPYPTAHPPQYHSQGSSGWSAPGPPTYQQGLPIGSRIPVQNSSYHSPVATFDREEVPHALASRPEPAWDPYSTGQRSAQRDSHQAATGGLAYAYPPAHGPHPPGSPQQTPYSSYAAPPSSPLSSPNMPPFPSVQPSSYSHLSGGHYGHHQRQTGGAQPPLSPPARSQPPSTRALFNPPSQSHDATTDAKRPRQARNLACSFCRGRKLRCIVDDGLPACRQCVRRRLKCSLPDMAEAEDTPPMPKARKRRLDDGSSIPQLVRPQLPKLQEQGGAAGQERQRPGDNDRGEDERLRK